MIKKLIALALCFFSFSGFAKTVCPTALPTTHPDFCGSFTTAAVCHCSSTLPKKMCEDVNKVYHLMMARYGSIEVACKFQKETTTEICIDDWNCYRKGGKDSQGGLCSGNGKACS